MLRELPCSSSASAASHLQLLEFVRSARPAFPGSFDFVGCAALHTEVSVRVRRRRNFPFTLVLLAAMLSSSAAALAAPAKMKIALLPLQGRDGVDQVLAAVVTEALAVELSNRPGLAVITPKDIEAALGFEKQKAKVNAAVAAQSGEEVCTDNSCLQEIGGALGVERMVSGSIARLGSSWILTVQTFDSRKAQVLKRYFTRVSSNEMDALLDVVPAAAEELFPGNESRPAAVAAPAAAPPPAPVETPEQLLERKCAGNDVASCLELVKARDAAGPMTAQTLAILVKTCDLRSAEGCNLAADALELGKSGDPEPARAAELRARSCELKATTAGCEAVAPLFRDGVHVKQDAVRAQKLFHQACTAGSPSACHASAELAAGSDEAAALASWKRGCELGSADACSQHRELDEKREKLAAVLELEQARKERIENRNYWRRAGYVSGGIGAAAGGAAGLLAFLGSQRNDNLKAGDYDDFGDMQFAVSSGTPLNVGAWSLAALATAAVGTGVALVLFNQEEEDDSAAIKARATVVLSPSSVTFELGGF